MTDHALDGLIAKVREDLAASDNPPHIEAMARLTALRDHGEFALLAQLAGKYLLEWDRDFGVIKLYAQALIDCGHVQAVVGYLNHVLDTECDDPAEAVELFALLGRANKDLFLRAQRYGQAKAAAGYAQASWDAYQRAYSISPDGDFYPRINAAAVADLAQSRGVRLDGDPDPREIARELCQALGDGPTENAWVHSTRAEARIPLEEWDGVELHLGRYLSSPNLTPFQHGGTLRQFKDVWRLAERGPRGEALLAMLRAECLWANRRASGDETMSVIASAEGIPDIAPESLEKVLGNDGLQTYEWLTEGVGRARSVAAVLTQARRRTGTAFVIDASEFGLAERTGGRACLMTNYHVLNQDGEHGALRPTSGAQVRFEARERSAGRDTLYRVHEILFQSPLRDGLDCTIFTIAAEAVAFDPIPIELHSAPDLHSDPKPRVYIIGYPKGGEMQFSLQDNRLLDHECPPDGRPPLPARRRVHYFAPTEPGNSGSPVFNEGWRCIALHHAGRRHDPAAGQMGMQLLNGQEGRHSANQGIWIGSIVGALSGGADQR